MNKNPDKINDLENFPFSNLEELNKSINEGVANLAVDKQLALRWLIDGKHSTRGANITGLLLAFLPILSAIGLIIYSIVVGNWWLLLSVPLLFVSYFILHPSSQMIFGPIRSLFIMGIWILFVYSFLNTIGWLVVLTFSLVIIWYSQKTIYKKAVNGILRASMKHEDLLCSLWDTGNFSVQFFNGDNYWVDHKTEKGELVFYKDNK